jgi:hypothetical protein
MKPSHWLDLVDITIRVLNIIRHLLTELWGGQGNGGVTAGERRGNDGGTAGKRRGHDRGTSGESRGDDGCVEGCSDRIRLQLTFPAFPPPLPCRSPVVPPTFP